MLASQHEISFVSHLVQHITGLQVKEFITGFILLP